MIQKEAQALLSFWYSDDIKKAWFASTQEIDTTIRQRYENLWQHAIQGELNDWMKTANGCLALIILLDQLPLNMFRGTVQSFSSEQQAVKVCYHAIEKGFDNDIIAQSGNEKIAFLYMPLMHSENLADQDNSVKYFLKAGLEENIRFAKHHRDIVETYGRFPHRNNILGRVSTPAEKAYLDSKNAFLG